MNNLSNMCFCLALASPKPIARPIPSAYSTRATTTSPRLRSRKRRAGLFSSLALRSLPPEKTMKRATKMPGASLILDSDFPWGGKVVAIVDAENIPMNIVFGYSTVERGQPPKGADACNMGSDTLAPDGEKPRRGGGGFQAGLCTDRATLVTSQLTSRRSASGTRPTSTSGSWMFRPTSLTKPS